MVLIVEEFLILDEEVVAPAGATVALVLALKPRVSRTTQSSSQASPLSLKRLCKTQHAVTRVGMFVILLSFLFSSDLHLPFSRPKAHSTTTKTSAASVSTQYLRKASLAMFSGGMLGLLALRVGLCYCRWLASLVENSRFHTLHNSWSCQAS